MAKKKVKKTRWDIKEEMLSGKFKNRDWDHRSSRGGLGFGLFLMIIALLWIAVDYAWIPSIRPGP